MVLVSQYRVREEVPGPSALWVAMCCPNRTLEGHYAALYVLHNSTQLDPPTQELVLLLKLLLHTGMHYYVCGM